MIQTIESMIEEALNEEILELTDEVLDVMPICYDPFEGMPEYTAPVRIVETKTSEMMRLHCDSCLFHGAVNSQQVLKGLDVDHMKCPRCKKHTVKISE